MTHEGFSGRLARLFARSKLTPVIIMVSLLLGILAVVFTPKEEEPQISVPMIDVQLSAPGFSAKEVERYITESVEKSLWAIEGVEYIYSASQNHGALITVRFKVGEPIEPSLVKVHHKLMLIQKELPPRVSVQSVKSYSIDDVPFLTLTFSSPSKSHYDLRQLVAPLAQELAGTPDLAEVAIIGGQRRVLRVVFDPQKLATKGITLSEAAGVLAQHPNAMPLGKNWSNDHLVDMALSSPIRSVGDINRLSVGQRWGQTVTIGDVAQVIEGPELENARSLLVDRDRIATAVSLSFAKRKGTNVVELSEQLIEKATHFQGNLPSDVQMDVLRNYGESAQDKTMVLIEHLAIATLSVTALIALFMGIRSAIVVMIAIPVTLALTLALYYFMGYTLNRVTFFALIFSIGILVDDAIVVVENIERHLRLRKNKSYFETIIEAVSEVGNPTILATFTVIAAILPMAFVRGLMGPYMKPIPVGASLAMMLSLFVAFIVTPWAAAKLLKNQSHQAIPDSTASDHHSANVSKLDRLYESVMHYFLASKSRSVGFGAMVLVLLLASFGLIANKSVKVKMLPFDNKSEFQVLLDYPTHTSIEQGAEWSQALAARLLEDPDVEKVQIFSGVAAPFSFSGMVKHTFLRNSDYQNELFVRLSPPGDRDRSSHEIIESLRPKIQAFAEAHQAISKVLEIPPGPPVLATLLAEVYAPDEASRLAAADSVKTLFASNPSVVDLDTTERPVRSVLQFPYQSSAAGLPAGALAQLGQWIFSEPTVLMANRSDAPEPIPVVVSVRQGIRDTAQPFESFYLRSWESGIAPAAASIGDPKEETQSVRYRKNLRPVSYVMAELSGEEEAPVYAILNLGPQIPYPTYTTSVPWPLDGPVVKWDGEWFITYEVFRDLGVAFALVLVLIFVLILGWFRSYRLPIIIMMPIPISLIGIIPGHWITGSYFTATSMIGFIAGAGIIVRNSIILVDFIQHQLDRGMALKEAVISAGVIRFRPMLLTAAAVVVGSSVMLTDPIFQGLAVSLIFGEVAATILSRFAVPILVYYLRGETP